MPSATEKHPYSLGEDTESKREELHAGLFQSQITL